MKFKLWLKSRKNIGHSTRRPKYILLSPATIDLHKSAPYCGMMSNCTMWTRLNVTLHIRTLPIVFQFSRYTIHFSFQNSTRLVIIWFQRPISAEGYNATTKLFLFRYLGVGGKGRLHSGSHPFGFTSGTPSSIWRHIVWWWMSSLPFKWTQFFPPNRR